MDSANIDINQPINITPMTEEEARECDAAIHQHLDVAEKHLDSASVLLLEMKRREGWKALDFNTWTEYLESRAVGKSRRRALELLQAEEVKQNLAMCGIPHTEIPAVTSQLTMLAQLPFEQQAPGLQKAEELARASGQKRTAAHISQVVKEFKSVLQETEAKGKALGLPTRGDSTLPESSLIDKLKHSSPTDVDDRLGAPPTQPKLYKHGIAAGDTVRILLGRGKHSDKITTATSVSAKEIVTPLGTFKPSALVKYVDRIPEMNALGIVPGVTVSLSDGTKAKVACTFADGRVLASGRYYQYSELTVSKSTTAQATDELGTAEAEGDAIAVSVETILPEIRSAHNQPDLTPTLAQWEAVQKQLVENQQALENSQAEIEQLKAERDELNAECLALQSKNGDLHNEIAHLKNELASLKQQLQLAP